REVGVDTGGSNVQFSINPKDGRMIVIEMNPRVSRSSALASKATGYPIAKIATLLAVGFTLDELSNDITGTAASFEPVIDYVVTKIPRFTFEKFPMADSTLSTAMKSVGEVMSIGRTFKESFQKALISLETGLLGFNSIACDEDELIREIRRSNENRVLYVFEALRRGKSVEEIFDWCKIDQWFLYQLQELAEVEKAMDLALLKDATRMREVKADGFSDAMIAHVINRNEGMNFTENDIYNAREKLAVRLEYNEVDTCAAEFEALTPYLYSSTNITKLPTSASLSDRTSQTFTERSRSDEDKKVLVIGGGPNRIGQGIEFDYCCVHAAFALKDMGVKSIMYNCNPETVSTDYDTSDILYFEPIDFEHVRNVIEVEKPDGVIVHFGGQTPLKLAKQLTAIGANISGTTARVIDLAEDRELFSDFIDKIGLKQPNNDTVIAKDEAVIVANRIGYPVLVRPSFVLGGRGMKTVYSDEELKQYMDEAVSVSHDAPVLIDKFLNNAIELDVDAICDGKDVYIGSVMQHIEEAGIHSGDSACALPTISISDKLLEEIKEQTSAIAIGLGVVGLMNIQYAIFKDEVYLIEVNPRASRTVPFVSKATGVPLAKVATRVMIQGDLKEALKFYDTFNVVNFDKKIMEPILKGHVAVKEAVFPFNKLPGADLLLGPEMKSTGEVMGISDNFGMSFAKSQFAAKNNIPLEGKLFLSLSNSDKDEAAKIGKSFTDLGFEIYATSGTHKALEVAGIKSNKVLKISEGRPNIDDMIKNNEIDLAINTSDEKGAKIDGATIRLSVLRQNIAYFTTIAAAKATAEAIKELKNSAGELEPKALQDYLN
ncbi:MAG: Carbamoyl-phosphate synthase large chain (EC, partial [uncultured Sulfurovum sp.]